MEAPESNVPAVVETEIDPLAAQVALVKGGADALSELRLQFSDAIEEVIVHNGELTVYVRRDAIVPVCRFLRDDPKLLFNLLSDLTAVDRGIDEEPRFETVYHLFSIANGFRLRLKARIPEEDCEIATVSGVWPTADWLERETYDLMGIRFTNHPDLRKILTPDDLEGHPLRKDFPLQGY